MATADAVLLDADDVLGGVIEAYRREGFDTGYRRATLDLLSAMVLNAEEFLHEQPGDAARKLRPTLYAFIERLERQVERDAQSHRYVEGGLGI
jgi:hypothetical protein